MEFDVHKNDDNVADNYFTMRKNPPLNEKTVILVLILHNLILRLLHKDVNNVRDCVNLSRGARAGCLR